MSSRRAVPVAVAVDWSDTGYWSRLTPNPGNSLAFIVLNCCVGGELVQHTTQLPPAVASSSPLLVVHARVTVYYTHLSWSRGGCTVGAEFCAERQTIAAKWLNCSQLNKCSNRICPLKNGAREERGSSFLPPPFPLFFFPLLRGNLLYSSGFTCLYPPRKRGNLSFRSHRDSSEEGTSPHSSFLIPRLLCVPRERVRARESRRGSRSLC